MSWWVGVESCQLIANVIIETWYKNISANGKNFTPENCKEVSDYTSGLQFNHTSKMIYHRGGGEPERACIADLIFCHGIQTMDSSKICHCHCFMSIVSKNFMQPFLWSRKLLRYTHTWTKIHKLSLVLMMSLFMALTWSELNYCAWSDGTAAPSVSSLDLPVIVRSHFQ